MNYPHAANRWAMGRIFIFRNPWVMGKIFIFGIISIALNLHRPVRGRRAVEVVSALRPAHLPH